MPNQSLQLPIQRIMSARAQMMSGASLSALQALSRSWVFEFVSLSSVVFSSGGLALAASPFVPGPFLTWWVSSVSSGLDPCPLKSQGGGFSSMMHRQTAACEPASDSASQENEEMCVFATVGEKLRGTMSSKNTLKAWGEAAEALSEKERQELIMNLKLFDSSYPLLFLGYDSDGRAVTAERLSDINFDGLKSVNENGIRWPLAIHALRMEVQMSLLKDSQHETTTHVVDLEGFSLKNTVSLLSSGDGWLRRMLSTRSSYDAAHYPQSVDRAIIINAPWYVASFTRALRPFLGGERTTRIIAIQAGLEGLHRELGETHKCVLPTTEESWKEYFSTSPPSPGPARFHSALLRAAERTLL